MTGLEELRRRYPWPEDRPEVPEELTGWFAGPNRDLLGELIAAAPQEAVVVELGSFRGMSSAFIADRLSPGATLICIDHWLGSEEHHRHDQWRQMLPTLYETFLCNTWTWRGRIIPMRTTTRDGLRELRKLGVRPDVIYVDAAHDEESVYMDVRDCLEFFPDAEICGDDWPHHSVRTGVVRAAAGWKLLDVRGCCAWHLKHDRSQK